MTTAAWLWLAAAGVVAVADWVAVARGDKRLEYACKPLTMVALAGAAVALVPVSPAQRPWFVAALAFGCAGDVFLMLPRDRFVPGLAAFLVGHLCYVAGFVARGLPGGPWVLLAVLVVPVAVAILRGVRSRPQLRAPVAVYMVVIVAMLASALASRVLLAAVGALLFVLSDALIGFQRFVRPRAWAPLAIIVTYHVGQGLLVASLTRGS